MKTALVFIALLYTMQAMPCAFCKGEIIEKQSVFSSKHFNVLLDYEPRAEGHLLIIPKRHMVNIHELNPEEWAEWPEILLKTIAVASKALERKDYIILEKNGPQAFQVVPHVHFHLIFPMEGQCWQDIFDSVPERLTPMELETQVTWFRSYFAS